MATIKRNSTSRDGKRIYTNYFIIVNLPYEKCRITIPNSSDNLKAVKEKLKLAESIEIQSKRKPDEDWKSQLYTMLELPLPKVKAPVEKKADTYTIKKAVKDMIAYKQFHKLVKTEKALESIIYTRDVLIEGVGNIGVNDYDRDTHNIYLQHLSNKGYNVVSKNIHLRQLKALLNWCFQQEKRDRFLKVELIKVDKVKNDVYISPTELEEVLTHVSGQDKEHTNLYKSYFRVYYYTGLRLREICWKPNEKHYYGLWHELIEVGDTMKMIVHGKMRRDTWTILPNELLEDYHTILSMPMLHPDTISKNFTKAVKKSRFKDKQLTLHGLRNCFIHNLFNHKRKDGSNLPTSTIQKLARHTNIAVTDGYYQDEQNRFEQVISDLN